MARYHVAFTTVAAATNAAIVDLRSGTPRLRLLELGLFNAAATACTAQLERTSTLGTASTTIVPVAGDPGDSASTALAGTAWSVAPANTGVPVRGIVLAANISAGVIWTFGYGDMVVAAAASLCVFNRGAATNGIMRGYMVFDE